MNQKVVRSVCTVVLFWWLAFAIWGLLRGSEEWELEFASTGVLAISLGWVMFAGAALVWLNIWSEKKVRRGLLESSNVRGLTCTIGDVPLIALEPKQHESLPPGNLVKEIPPGWYDQWLAKYDSTHPAHAELMRCFLRIYNYYAHLPATHIEGGHGSRTLLDHSLLVGYYMDRLSRSWRYTGLRDRTGKRVILKLRDADYTFQPDDPLVALLGVAHDIGKIEAFIFDKNGGIIGIHHEHDLTGARMIARIPCAWKISDEDRRAILLSIAHYHHPMELPLSPDRRAIDDRTIALMELLIKADFVVSRIESGGPEPTESDFDQSVASIQSAETTPDRLLKAFLDIIGEHSRIKSVDKRFSVGTLCDGQGFAKPMLLINEASMRSALIQRLKLSDQIPLGDRRYQITIDLLKAIDAKGFLYRKHESVEFSAENAIWNVDFFARPEKGAPVEKKAGWSAVIIVDPKIHPKIEQADPYWWYAMIARGTMGSARRLNKSGSVIAKHRNQNSLDGDDEEVAAALKKAGSTFSALQDVESGPESPPPDVNAVVIEDDEEEGEIGPETGESYDQWVSDPQKPVALVSATKLEEATVPKASGKIEAHQLTPVVVRTALANVIAASSGGQIPGTVTEHAGMYVLSSQKLMEVLPQIDWVRYRYQIETFCASGTLEAQLVEDKDGHYIIAVMVGKI